MEQENQNASIPSILPKPTEIPKKKSLVEMEQENQNPSITQITKPTIAKPIQDQSNVDDSLKIQMIIDDKFTTYSLIQTQASPAEKIENSILVNGKKYSIPSLGCFMFRSKNESSLESLIAGSDFEFVEDNETKFIALKLKGSSNIITMNEIIDQLVKQIQDQLKKNFNKIAGEVLVTIPMMYTSTQKEEYQKCLKKAGFREIQFVDSSTLLAAACSESVQTERIVLVGSWTSTHLELAVAKIGDGKIEVFEKNVSFSLGTKNIKHRITRVLWIKIHKIDFFDESNISEDEMK
jgi:hypothetical protein